INLYKAQPTEAGARPRLVLDG
ncbi:MAG: hypothetical protein CG437_1217, partial [Methanosaeta sp. NSP1]